MIESTANEPAFDRLLQKAVEVFAEYGFRDATVREICSRANVNVASVNYYFRSKEALYNQAVAFAFREVNRLYPQNAALDAGLPPEQRLGLFIDNFLHKLLDDSHLGLHSKLITREISDPTSALDEVIASSIAPQCALLEEIIMLVLGAQVEPGEAKNKTSFVSNPLSSPLPEGADNAVVTKTVVHRCILSILGQCLMFKHSRSVIDRFISRAH